MDHTHTSPQEAAHGTGTPGDGLQAQPHSPQEAPHSGTGTPGDGTGDPCLALLNPRQREAVCCTDAPSLVIAGAGSGKTRVLTAKIAWLLSHEGMEPQHIMALTFTNKAALEMKQRVAALVGPGAAARITMGTFHSVLARILRREHQAIGYPADYTIYDTSDSESLLGQVIGGLGLDRKRQYKPQAVLGRISRAKNMLLQPSQYPAALAQADQAAGMPAVGRIWREYQDRLRQAGAMDFDDILVNAWLLLRDHPGAARRYQDLYHYVLVDEYQDTNYAQHQIVLLLTRERQRVCVVGDDAQSIYSFRGAEIDNILHFRDAYPGARLFRLERNYRSTRTIVEAASSLIGHNQGQIPKQVFSLGDQGSPIEVFHTYSDQDEAATLARHLTRLHREERLPYSQMAILYRTNSQSRSLEEELRRRDIPYHIYGGLSFYQRKEVKDAIAYLRLCVNPRDETALRRVINYPARGIGEATLERVWQAAARGGVSPWEVVAAPQGHGLAAAPARRLAAFATLVAQLRESMEAGADAYGLALQALSLSGMQAEVFQGSGLDDLQRQQNLQELTDSIGTFVQERREQGLPAGAADWLQEVSLLTDPAEGRDGDAGDGRVTLMTVHASKGLEFQAVCVAGMEEGLFPGQAGQDNARALEEERRLFYVAMTRAARYLALSSARSRMRYGHMEFSAPSRFLAEIDPRYLHVNGRSGHAASPGSPTPSSFRAQAFPPGRPGTSRSGPVPQPGAPLQAPQPGLRMASLSTRIPASASAAGGGSSSGVEVRAGQRIAHERFGQGTVERVEGGGMDARATVLFDTAGRKQLLLRFARLKVL